MIKIRARSSTNDDVSLLLSVSLPATYPKSLPHLNLTFGDGVFPEVREKALHVINSRSKALLGAEMIFEIATALQDLLDQALEATLREYRIAETKSNNTLNLHQERAIQEAAVSQKARYAVEEKEQAQKEMEEEGQRQLSYMVEQEKLRMANRKAKQPATADPFELEDNVPGGIRFDQPVIIADTKGSTTVFHTVHQKVSFRQGRVGKIFTVHRLGSPPGSAPFLALKEYHLSLSSDENTTKRQIHDLESLLDKLKNLPSHPHISRPLNFNIQRCLNEGGSIINGWDISILTMLSEKGSVKDILHMIGILNLDIIRTWAIQLLEALDFYHRNGIVHGSLHVGNILLEEAETGNTIVKLTDGSYQYSLRAMKERETSNISTDVDLWIAPELIDRNTANPVPSTDIWDFGVILLQMIFGLKIKDQETSPSAFLGSRDLTRSAQDFFHFIFLTDSKKRKSAFDLKMFEFFRTEEPVFREPSLYIASENLAASIATSSMTHPRRNSVPNPPSTSRYLNDFEEIGRLGRGGYGEVVKARHKLENQIYAIKKIRQGSASALSKVLSEIVMLSKLNHPNVVRYFTAWTENDGKFRPGSALSSSSGSALSLTDGNPDGLFAKSSGGLDFIGADPPNIVFGFDDEDDDEEGKPVNIKGNVEETEKDNDRAGEESEPWDEEESNGESENESDDELNDPLHWPRRRHSSSHESAVGTTLYIQMQYCENKVNTLFLARPFSD